jgi:hypothetical protein
MRGPEFLRQRVGKLNSRMGGFVPGSHATVRGLDLHTAFKDKDWTELFFYAGTGRRFSPSELRLLQTLWSYSSYPDARLWNNRVAALAGSARSTGSLALAAALAVSEATIYGRGADIRAITFLKETLRAVADGGSIADCVRKELDVHRGIAGYGRPLTSKDERIEPTLKLAAELGLDQGPHLRLAFDIDDYLSKGRWRMRINYAALAAALSADTGFSPAEYYLCGFPTFLAGMLPCYLEALEQPEGALFPIPCEDIAYAGREKRSWAERGRSGQSGPDTDSPATGADAAPGD